MEWWQTSKPSEIKPIPWLHPEVTRYLESILRPDWTVIEHGSGGSTLWLADRVAENWAFESDTDWLAEMLKQRRLGMKVLSGLGVTPAGGFPFIADLLLIDGEPVEERAEWLKAAPKLVKPGGWVVLDNCNRPEYEAERLALQKYAEYHVYFHTSRGGQKYLNSEFYKLP